MNRPSRLVKVLVLLSSVSLAGCFVAYRAGAFEDKGTENTMTVMPSSKSMPLPASDTPRQDSPRTIMGSSKDAPIFVPEQDKSADNEPIMGGSKSDEIFQPNQNAPQKPETVKVSRFYMDEMESSKSGRMFYPKPDTAKPPRGDSAPKPVNDFHHMGSSKSGGIFTPPPPKPVINGNNAQQSGPPK